MEKEITASGEKIAIIGDLHLSPKCENASIRSAVVGGQEAFIDKLVADLHAQGIKKAVFCGDLFTTRTFISVTGLEYAIDMFRNKLKDIECYVIAGNHDLTYENSAESTSIRTRTFLTPGSAPRSGRSPLWAGPKRLRILKSSTLPAFW